MLVYLDGGRGISAGLALGALLDAGADAALVQRILGKVMLPRVALMRAREERGTISGTVASVAIGPVRRDALLIDAVRAVAANELPLAVRTWGGGLLTRYLEAEAIARDVSLDAVPLADPITVAELIAVSAALATLRAVRVYAAPLRNGEAAGDAPDSARPTDSTQHVRQIALVTALLLAEAEWPEPTDGAPDAVVTPGGAAILAALAEPGLPPLRLTAVGYGVSADAPHVLRCLLGEPYTAGAGTMPPTTRSPMLAHTHPHDNGDDQ